MSHEIPQECDSDAAPIAHHRNKSICGKLCGYGRRLNTPAAERLLSAGAVVIYAMTLLTVDFLRNAGGESLVLICCAIVYLAGGYRFFISAYRLLLKRNIINEYSIICIATLFFIALGNMTEATGAMLLYSMGLYAADALIDRFKQPEFSLPHPLILAHYGLNKNIDTKKSSIEILADRLARYSFLAALGLAVLAAVLPPSVFFFPDRQDRMYTALVLFAIAYPGGLLMSIPLCYCIGIKTALLKGIYLKENSAFDRLHGVDTVVFDQTDSLPFDSLSPDSRPHGTYTVAQALPAPGISTQALSDTVALLEETIRRPIGFAVFSSVRQEETAPGFFAEDAGAIAGIPGKGIQITLQDTVFLAGTYELLADSGVVVPEGQRTENQIYLAEGTRFLGSLLINTTSRNQEIMLRNQEMLSAVQTLKRLKLKTYLLTGEEEEHIAKTAEQIGLSGYWAGLLPEKKSKALQAIASGSHAAFVGNSIDDAPVFSFAHAGILTGITDTESAVQVADAATPQKSPVQVARLFLLSRKIRTVALQNSILLIGTKAALAGLGSAGICGLWEVVLADIIAMLFAIWNATRITRENRIVTDCAGFIQNEYNNRIVPS